jgi:ammonium transporter Rh
MIGTLFLFVYFPSFNSATLIGVAQQRSIVNTLYAISGSALMAVFISRMMIGKLDMQILMFATLAGGVMVAASSNLIFNGGYAMLVGCLAGIASSLGYLRLDKFMESKVKIHDTCGVHFLHGIPGWVGGIVSAVCAGFATYNF